MQRLFVKKDRLPLITGSDAHYLKDVLRSRVGDELELFDGSGAVYRSKITSIGKEEVITAIISRQSSAAEPAVKVTLAQALPKGSKMDFIVEKCVELGVSRIVPILTERTIGKAAKPERWQKIAKEAAEQSGRAVVPAISELTTFEDLIKLKINYDLALIPWELEKEIILKQVLTTKLPDHPNILLLIGPEGGFTQQEVAMAKKAGFISVSLGKRILRTETAGMAALAAIMYQLEAV